jgi:phage recombination protein Bet
VSNEIAIRGNSVLAVHEEQTFWTDRQITVLKSLGLEEATQSDLGLFFHQCTRTGLDPFAKQIYMIGRKAKENGQFVTKYTIQTGIDGYRLIARRAADRAREKYRTEATLWCGEDGVWRDVWLGSQPPAAAKVTVVREGEPFTAVAVYQEYVQLAKDYQTQQMGPNSMWKKMAANQLSKCAEAAALRKAFPQDLSGVYVDAEMGQADNPVPAPRPSETLNLLQDQPIQDLGEQRDWKAEATALAGNIEALQNLYGEAQAASADAETLTHIRSQAGENA